MTTAFEKLETGIARRDLLALVGSAAAAGSVAAGRAFAQSQTTTGAASAQPPEKNTVTLDHLPGGVLLIGIDRTEAQNRIDIPTFNALGQAYYEFEHDSDLRVAVLHAEGRISREDWTSHPGAPVCGRDRFRPHQIFSIRSARAAPSGPSL